LEFSFDRSKDAASKKPEVTPQNTAGPRPGPDLNTVDPSTIANERLRKAIERNRAKQAGREPLRQPTSAPQQPMYAQPTHQATPEAPPHHAQEPHHQASFFEKATRETFNPSEGQQAQSTQEAPRARENTRPQSTSVVSRRSVAKPDDTEFVPVKRTTRKVASQISYATSSARKKPKSLDPKIANYLVKGCWIFCVLMILRLIFSNGGVTDYYSQKSQVHNRLEELSQIKKENMTLVREIERMRHDTGYQKKLVRDNLGFIASDEFLVLFPKD
jgi:cell division protein FtsB